MTHLATSCGDPRNATAAAPTVTRPATPAAVPLLAL